MSIYQNWFLPVSQRFHLFPFSFQISTLHRNYGIVILFWSHKRTPPVTMKRVRIENTNQGSQANVSHTSRRGCVGHRMISRRGQPCKALVSTYISISYKKEIPSPIKISGGHRSSHSFTEESPRFLQFSRNWPEHLLSIRVLCSQSWERENRKRERRPRNTYLWLQKSSADRRAGYAQRTKYYNRAPFHCEMLAAVWAQVDDREKEPLSNKCRAPEQIKQASHGTSAAVHKKIAFSVLVHLLGLLIQLDNIIPSWDKGEASNY